MTWDERKAIALAKLRKIFADDPDGMDPDFNHKAADDVLVELIDDAEIAAAYAAINKWYS